MLYGAVPLRGYRPFFVCGNFTKIFIDIFPTIWYDNHDFERRIVQEFFKAIYPGPPMGAKAIRTAGSTADRQLGLPY